VKDEDAEIWTPDSVDNTLRRIAWSLCLFDERWKVERRIVLASAGAGNKGHCWDLAKESL
jgi:hypothetical protein